jgi:hypothetical protein
MAVFRADPAFLAGLSWAVLKIPYLMLDYSSQEVVYTDKEILSRFEKQQRSLEP